MAWDMVRMEVHGHTSAHNSDQDEVDDSLWEEFARRVEAIAAEHRYASLRLEVYGPPGGRHG